MSFEDKDLQSIQEARILVERAKVAQETLKEYEQSYLDKLVSNLIASFSKESSQVIETVVTSIGCGNPKDEKELYQLFMENFEKEYSHKKYVGILERDTQNHPIEVGIPLGVIGAQLPATNLVLNMIYTTLICLKTGNSLIIIPDQHAVEETTQLVHLINQMITKDQGPSDVIGCMKTVSSLGIDELCNHPSLSLFLNIGSTKYIDYIAKGKTPYLFGGVGSSPVFIERTANIKRACHAISYSRSFNNGLLPGAEQYVVVENSIADEVKRTLITEGAYFMTAQEETMLLHLIYPFPGELSATCVGKSACYLANKAGFQVPESTTILVSEQPYINEENPYAEDLPMPILTYYLEPNWVRGCEKCIELLEYKKNGHTLVIHSENQEVITEFILKKPVGRVIVNGLGGLNSLGIDSKLPTSMILGGLTTAKGFSAENITPKHLTYLRHVSHQENQSEVYSEKECQTTLDGLEELNVFAELLKEITN